MPKHKDFKRLVRARMRKTGEAYTTARAQLLKKKGTPTADAAPPARADYATLAGMSDTAVKAKTGRTWDEWVRVWDQVQAAEWEPREIADHVYREYQVPGWWAQTVTVGYERIRGLREIGQRRGGSYEASKSKTLPVPLARLYRACSDAKTRARWLRGATVKVRTATRNRSLRLTWADGTSVEMYFTGKGAAKSQVAVQHRKLATRAGSDAMKRYWSKRLDALAEILGTPKT